MPHGKSKGVGMAAAGAMPLCAPTVGVVLVDVAAAASAAVAAVSNVSIATSRANLRVADGKFSPKTRESPCAD